MAVEHVSGACRIQIQSIINQKLTEEGKLTFFVLDLGFDILYRVGGLDLKRDGLASESLYKYLHFVAEIQENHDYNHEIEKTAYSWIEQARSEHIRISTQY